jgi:ubiquinone/menaquinone biosynthesis C-methylase UbiE
MNRARLKGKDKERVAATYNAAADSFDALSFWQYYGEQSAARAQLRAGEIVLDVCSGTGASAIPAARAVGPMGRVIGLDLAPGMIAVARAKAPANVEFRHADFDQAYFRNASFDAVLCVFGIFFFPDMCSTLQKMWRLLRPGGRLVITTWGTDVFEPGDTIFWNAVREVRPELFKSFNAWDQLSLPDQVCALFEQADMPSPEMTTEDRDHPLRSVEDWWSIVMGTGYRGTVDQLTPEERDRVRAACLAAPSAGVRIPANYAVAKKA